MKSQIETAFVVGELDVNDIVMRLQSEDYDMDEVQVMTHFNEHEDSLGAEVMRKKKFLGTPKTESEAELTGEYVEEPLPVVKNEKINNLEQLVSIYSVLKTKFWSIATGKDIRGISTVAKEIRETLKEIERVRKDTKASLADRTDQLFAEHNEMNRFLMFNLCTECGIKYESYLKGEFTTFAVDAHGREDRVLDSTDVVDSGTVD